MSTNVIDPPYDDAAFLEWCINAPAEDVEDWLRARGHDVAAIKSSGAMLTRRLMEHRHGKAGKA